MGVSVSRNFGDLTDVVLLTVSDWGRVGRLARERLISRTLAGRDETDAAFAPYSPGYAKAKAALGASTTPNLQLSGDMLNSIVVEPDADGVTLTFA